MNKLYDIYKNNNSKCNYGSYPQKKNKKCSIINEYENTEICTFVGIAIDILFGLIYLLQTHKEACTTMTSNFVVNDDLCQYYANMQIKINSKCEFLNFEIVWIYKKLFFSDRFEENFKKCLDNISVRFIIIPLGIEIKEGNHANYLIFDKKTFELERFEPYGSSSPFKFNYNSKLLDSILTFKFNEIDQKIKYISPSCFLPKIGFQYFDAYESKTQKIGDPNGFCGLWTIWYCDMRLKFPDINRKSLFDKLLKETKIKNLSFKNLIRNYSQNIIAIRDNIFASANITINDWLNDNYTDEQYKKIISKISNLINSCQINH